jgi:hypothetical protein
MEILIQKLGIIFLINLKRIIDMINMTLCMESFSNWAEQEQLIIQATRGFWKSFLDYKIDDPEEYTSHFDSDDDTLISLVEPMIALATRKDQIDCPDIFDDDYCFVRFEIEYKGERIGYYKYFFTLEGKCFDDIFDLMPINKEIT